MSVPRRKPRSNYSGRVLEPHNDTGSQLELGSLAGFCGQGLVSSSPCGTSLTTQLIIAFTGLGALAGSIITPAGGPEDEQPGDPAAEARIQTAAEQDLTNLECGGESFTPGTKVLLASGTAVPIASLRPGDKILATNVKTGTTQAEPITAVLVHHDTNRYNLTIKTAHGTTVIHTTTTHLFWNPATRQWVKAAALTNGDSLRTLTGSTATVVRGRAPRDRTGWMWDLTVTGDHDFYIDAANTAFLAHNCAMSDAERLATRVNEIHGVLDPIAQNERTTAVMSTEEGVDVLASGVRDLSPAQRELANEGDLLARLPGEHAEITAMDAAAKAGFTPSQMAVSRPICSVCQLVITVNGGEISADEQGAVWP